MEEKEMNEFSWTSLFFVTSFCFFSFSGLLKFLDGDHSWLFIRIGILALLLGLLSWAGKLIRHAGNKSKRNLTS